MSRGLGDVYKRQIFAYLLPAVWPYSYSEQMKGSNNLKPFEYSASEQA